MYKPINALGWTIFQYITNITKLSYAIMIADTNNIASAMYCKNCSGISAQDQQ